MAKFLGIPNSGAQGGQVFSRNRFGQYTRTRAVPVNPNTPKQREARASLACCAAAWRELTARQKLAWKEFGQTQKRRGRLGQEYTMTGNMAFVSVNAALAKIGQEPLTLPPALPSFTTGLKVTVSDTLTTSVTLTVETDTVMKTGEILILETSHECSAGCSFADHFYYVAHYDTFTEIKTAIPIADDLLATLGTLLSDYQLFLRISQQISGVRGPQLIVPFILTGTGKYLSQAEERLEKWRDQIRQKEEAKEQAAKNREKSSP
ncbi:MAG: hypothetical protein M2R45_04176 [Verrucomicrobia subdivision 3 bacterium]|nr:hypothetical protein [Limisphaerales bacterium]MCS1413019.1 hypothetical protein [Limisphaerales bacterium]